MENEGLAVQVLPGLVLDRHHRIENERLVLEEDAEVLHLLHDGEGRCDADVGLAADGRLDRQILLGERGYLVVDAAILGTSQRHRHRERLDVDHVPPCDAHGAAGGLHPVHSRTEHERSSADTTGKDGSSRQSGHGLPP